MSNSFYQLSIIVPAYNEENRLPNTLEQLNQFIEQQTYRAEVVVVENTSLDRTFEIAQAFTDRHPEFRFVHETRRGKVLASPDLEILIANLQWVYNVTEASSVGLYRSRGEGEYLQDCFDYLIASSYPYHVALNDPAEEAQREQFYSALDQEYTLVKAFSPNDTPTESAIIFDEMYGPVVSLWQRLRPGSAIKIYAVQPAEAP